jgi:hypothetical protein
MLPPAIWRLAPNYCDQQIADILQQEGWRTSRGALFTDNNVNSIHIAHTWRQCGS